METRTETRTAIIARCREAIKAASLKVGTRDADGRREKLPVEKLWDELTRTRDPASAAKVADRITTALAPAAPTPPQPDVTEEE